MQNISEAIEAAIAHFAQLDKSADIYGYNDCYTFVSIYLEKLYGHHVLPALEYHDNKSFQQALYNYGGIDRIIRTTPLRRINTSRDDGDIAVAMIPRVGLSIMISHQGQWITAAGTDGIVPVRPVKKIERALQIFRPEDTV